MAKRFVTDVELQNECIKEECQAMAEFLSSKNTSYDGSVFKEVTYCGKVISPTEGADIRITDKLRRLQSSDPNFNGEDAELDLLGYLLLKRCFSRFTTARKKIAAENRAAERATTDVKPVTAPRKRRTKAEIAADEAAKSVPAETEKVYTRECTIGENGEVVPSAKAVGIIDAPVKVTSAPTGTLQAKIDEVTKSVHDGMTLAREKKAAAAEVAKATSEEVAL
jgi:hypothetical protein